MADFPERLAALLDAIESENQPDERLPLGELNHREGVMHTVIRIREELLAPAVPADERPESDKRWNEALDWLLNSRHTADPDIQAPFWAYVDGKITREELNEFSSKDVAEREKKLTVTFVKGVRCGGCGEILPDQEVSRDCACIRVEAIECGCPDANLEIADYLDNCPKHGTGSAKNVAAADQRAPWYGQPVKTVPYPPEVPSA